MDENKTYLDGLKEALSVCERNLEIWGNDPITNPIDESIDELQALIEAKQKETRHE